MTVPISQVVRVTLQDTSYTPNQLDQSMSLIATTQYSDAFIDGLYTYASSASEVARNFGSASDVYKVAEKVFSHDQAPAQIMIGFWNKDGISLDAKANKLQATQSPLQLSALSTTYNFTITARRVKEVISFVADETVKDYQTFTEALNKSLGDNSRFVFSFDDGLFSLSSKVVGSDLDTDNIQITVDSFESSDLADDLRLSLSRNVKQVRGMNAKSGSKQTAFDLINALEDKALPYYGFYASNILSDSEIVDFSTALQATSKPHIFYYTATVDYMLDADNTNPIYQIALTNNRRTVVQLNKTGDRHAVVALMVQAGSTNWQGENTAQNLKFTEQNVNQVDENIDVSVTKRADRLGINYYASFDGVPMLANGRTVGINPFFIDSTLLRDAVKNALEVDLLGVLKRLSVPQDDIGQVSLLNQANATLERFARAGGIGRNLKWNGKSFGLLNTGDILQTGYYAFSESYELQSQANRELRKGQPILIALKESGKINELDVLVSVER